MARILFIQPHKTVLTSDLDKGRDNEFLSERVDGFARVVPSVPAMAVLGALKNHQAFFIDATADNPSNIFQYNKNVSLIGMSNEELYDKVNDTGADIVMLTSMFSSEYFVVNHISNLVKNRFKLPVVVGGHHATLRPSWHLDEGHADIVALGEGELNVNNIVDGILGRIPLPSVKGIAYNKNGSGLVRQEKSGVVSNLDRDWDIEAVVKSADGSYRYPVSLVVRNPALYLGGKPASEGAGVLYASRGCPYACEYCNATNRDGPKIRHMSLEKMTELTEEFIAFGAYTFHNESDTFGIHPIDREFLKWIAEQRESGQDINLVNTNGFFASYFFPGKKFSRERVDILKRAGFKTLTIAPDSFAERFNRGKLRGITFEMLKECFSYIRQQGLNLDVYMIYLFPKQTNSELRTDIRNIELLSDNITTTTWRSLAYFPGTEYYSWAIKTRKFTEEEYKGMIQKGHSFYHMNKRFNFSNIKNPPLLLG